MKKFNQNIINSLLIIGLLVLVGGGCQQINDAINSKTETNTNTTTNNNAPANANATRNANANTSASPSNSAANANTSASNTTANIATSKEEVPLTKEAEVFKNNLVGEWIDDYERKHKFTEDTYEFNIGTSDLNKGSYKVVNENTLELVDSSGSKWSATMRIEGDGNTLVWTQPQGEWKFKRVK